MRILPLHVSVSANVMFGAQERNIRCDWGASDRFSELVHKGCVGAESVSQHPFRPDNRAASMDGSDNLAGCGARRSRCEAVPFGSVDDVIRSHHEDNLSSRAYDTLNVH